MLLKVKIPTLLLVIFVTASALQAEDSPAKLTMNKERVKAFFKSLLIPGWGQMNNGQTVKSIAFVTAELAGIYAYKDYYQSGDDLADEFMAYADVHWDYNRWYPNNTDTNGDGVFDEACGNLRTHEMPERIPGENGLPGIPLKDHHFYENIGKYPEFSCGWDDYTEGGINYDYDDDPETNKEYYIDMRTRSNNYYRNAQYAATLIMVNHLVSAFDAGFGVDLTQVESENYSGKIYFIPGNLRQGITLEVSF